MANAIYSAELQSATPYSAAVKPQTSYNDPPAN